MKNFLFLLIGVVLAGCAVYKGTTSLHPFDGDGLGCRDFVVYRLTKDNTEYISIAFSAKSIEMREFQAYGIGKTDIMQVKRRKYKEPIIASLCSDFMTGKPELLQEEAPSQGTVEIIVSSEEREKAKKNQEYRITVVLKKVIFEDSAIDYLRIEDVLVGWLPG